MQEGEFDMRREFLLALAVAAPFAVLGATSASAQLKVGVAGPITGGSAAFGAQLKNGAEQAVADINAAGGILGQKIVLSIGDDRADPKEGVSVANKFVGDGVKLLVGHFNSGVTIPASLVYAENGMLAITPAATNPCVTDRKLGPCGDDKRTHKGLLMFRTCGRDDQQGAVAGAYIAKKFAGKKVAIIHDKTTYGLGLAVETRKSMNAKGVKEVMFEGVNKEDKDFSALVSKTKAAGADLIYWGGLHDAGGLLLRQMRDQGVKATFMGADGITSDEFAVIAGPGAEGTLMTYGPDPRKRPEAKAVVEKFRAKNFEPEAYTLYSYAAMQVLKQAAEAEKSVEPKKVANRIYSGMKFKTVIGELAYDKKGDVTRLDYVMYIWKKDAKGKITYVELE
jgi:branched-chain amino acid transport system substrate-binding protein